MIFSSPSFFYYFFFSPVFKRLHSLKVICLLCTSNTTSLLEIKGKNYFIRLIADQELAAFQTSSTRRLLFIYTFQYTINGKKVEVAVKGAIMGQDVPQKGALANPDCLQLYYNIKELEGYWNYRNDLKFLDRQVWANSVDPDQTTVWSRGLHCLTLCLHVLDTLLYVKITFFKFEDNYSHFSGVLIVRIITVLLLMDLGASSANVKAQYIYVFWIWKLLLNYKSSCFNVNRKPFLICGS